MLIEQKWKFVLKSNLMKKLLLCPCVTSVPETESEQQEIDTLDLMMKSEHKTEQYFFVHIFILLGAAWVLSHSREKQIKDAVSGKLWFDCLVVKRDKEKDGWKESKDKTEKGKLDQNQKYQNTT